MTAALDKKTGYTFSNAALLEKALTHSSIQNKKNDNERLEFLGDRVLGLVIAELLFKSFPDDVEGSLAKRHTALVQQDAIVKVAHEINLADHLRLSASEMKSGGQKKEKILSDAQEALIGAIYLDGGFSAAYAFVEKFWGPLLRQQITPPEDSKSRLQEWVQAKSLPLPVYKILSKSGIDHAPMFEIELSVESIGKTTATAPSKRAAEKAAALKMLEKIGIQI